MCLILLAAWACPAFFASPCKWITRMRYPVTVQSVLAAIVTIAIGGNGQANTVTVFDTKTLAVLCTLKAGKENARPTPIPDSFTILVVGPEK